MQKVFYKCLKITVWFWLAIFFLAICAFSYPAILLITKPFTYTPYDNEPQNWQVVRAAPGSLIENEYHFGNSNPKDMTAAYVHGTDCKNLRGSTFWSGRGHHYESFRYGAALGPHEKAKREEWHNNRVADGLWLCFPKVKNIGRYLEKGGMSNGGKIWLKQGPMLDFVPDKPYPVMNPTPPFKERAAGLPKNATWISGQYGEVKKIYPCSEKTNEFCASLDFFVYNYTHKKYQLVPHKSNEYRVFCWRCAKLRASPKSLQQSILSGLNFDYSSTAFRLDGGFMVQDNFSARNLKNARTAERLEWLRLLASIAIE